MQGEADLLDQMDAGPGTLASLAPSSRAASPATWMFSDSQPLKGPLRSTKGARGPDLSLSSSPPPGPPASWGEGGTVSRANITAPPK